MEPVTKNPKIIKKEDIESEAKEFRDTKESTELTPLQQDFLKQNKEITKKVHIPEQIDLPKSGKLISTFAKEISEILKDKNKLFFRTDTRDIVEIGKIKISSTEEKYNGFLTIPPKRFITLIEDFIIPGYSIYDEEKGWIFKERSMSSELSNTLLNSDVLQRALPQINRIFTIPIPIIHNGELTFPERGYDHRFKSWLPPNSPEIENPEMSLIEAKKLIDGLFDEFCFETEQDKCNAIAGLLTPFLRGIYPKFCTRTPLFCYIANRERAGKDYLAGITGLVYEGHAIEESPISSSENNKGNNTDELRKKVLAGMINGRKRMHFSNNKGYINNAVFEAIITAEQYSDRVLGRNEILTFDNEIDFSLSGNTGIGFTADLANRARFVNLFLDIEDANSRKFVNPNLHRIVIENRGLILSAMYSLVKNWIDKKMPPGTIPLTSFPDWASICGGIMECAEYTNPCNGIRSQFNQGCDNETMDMKVLFEECYRVRPEGVWKKNEIRDLVTEDGELFSYLDFSKKGDQTKFGNMIKRFINRLLSDIRLTCINPGQRAARHEFIFTKITKKKCNYKTVANTRLPTNMGANTRLDAVFTSSGNLGILQPQLKPVGVNILQRPHELPTIPRLPNLIFQKPLEKFIGTDLKEYGPFEIGDEAKIPEDMIEQLKKSKIIK